MLNRLRLHKQTVCYNIWLRITKAQIIGISLLQTMVTLRRMVVYCTFGSILVFTVKMKVFPLVSALISNHVYYCMSFYRDLSSFNLNKLKCIQNTHTRIVTNHKFAHVKINIKRFHYLHAEYSFTFKTNTLVYKLLQTIVNPVQAFYTSQVSQTFLQ